MKLIKLTCATQGDFIYVNPEHIGHLYQVKTKFEYGREKEPAHTRVGVTTHNNGGFKVAEDVEQIVKLIEKTRHIS